MELSKHDINQISNALSYAIMFAKTEAETAEFAILKVKFEGEKTRREQKQIICNNCHGCGCTFCGGYGYFLK